MKNRRTLSLLMLLVAMMALPLYFAVDRMVISKQKILSSTYSDVEFRGLMERLIASGVFLPEGNVVVVDERALAGQNLTMHVQERVRRHVPFLYVKDGRVLFDGQAVSIRNHRVSPDDRIVRGRFLDRNGVVLADSVVDEKVWKLTRRYPEGPAFYPIIGHFSAVYGTRNLEKTLEGYLSGTHHAPVYRQASDPMRKAKLGDDVTLTLDSRIQKKAFALMGGKRGAVVVLDVSSGEVLAAVSTPSFDPSKASREEWRRAFADTREKVYENRAFNALYPPGSTFKAVVASAWIERTDRGTGDLRRVNCTGKKNRYGISDIHAHGEADLEKAFAKSCNIFFSEAGVQLGSTLMTYAERFGFNGRVNLIPGVDGAEYLAGESLAFSWQDRSSSSAAVRKYSGRDYQRNPKIVAQGAIGQNLVTATPLQMAMVAAAIARQGVMMNPYVVREITTGDGLGRVYRAQPVVMGRAVSEKTAAEISRLMAAVMQHGTGREVKRLCMDNGAYTTAPAGNRCAAVAAAGKTGTAEVGDRNGNGAIDPDERPHSWFIGFAPAHDPKVAIAVIAENQGLGSLTAAPIAMDVLAEALNSRAARPATNIATKTD